MIFDRKLFIVIDELFLSLFCFSPVVRWLLEELLDGYFVCVFVFYFFSFVFVVYLCIYVCTISPILLTSFIWLERPYLLDTSILFTIIWNFCYLKIQEIENFMILTIMVVITNNNNNNNNNSISWVHNALYSISDVFVSFSFCFDVYILSDQYAIFFYYYDCVVLRFISLKFSFYSPENISSTFYHHLQYMP